MLFAEVVDLPSIEASLRQLLPQAPPERIAVLVHNMPLNHLEPEVVGQIATAAGVKRVILAHCVPGFKELRDPKVLVRRVAGRYKGPVALAHELERFQQDSTCAWRSAPRVVAPHSIMGWKHSPFFTRAGSGRQYRRATRGIPPRGGPCSCARHCRCS